jgi:hypothetical protein
LTSVGYNQSGITLKKKKTKYTNNHSIKSLTKSIDNTGLGFSATNSNGEEVETFNFNGVLSNREKGGNPLI